MGLLKDSKDMKDMVEATPGMAEATPGMAEATPGMIDSAQQLQANALAPISGVSIETYTAIIKELGARGNDQSLLPQIAQSRGVAPADWDKAREGWGARIKNDRALGTKFNTLYTSA